MWFAILECDSLLLSMSLKNWLAISCFRRCTTCGWAAGCGKGIRRLQLKGTPQFWTWCGRWCHRWWHRVTDPSKWWIMEGKLSIEKGKHHHMEQFDYRLKIHGLILGDEITNHMKCILPINLGASFHWMCTYVRRCIHVDSWQSFAFLRLAFSHKT